MPSAESLANAREIVLEMPLGTTLEVMSEMHDAIAAALDAHGDAVRAEERAKGDALVAAAQQAAVEIGEAAWRKREEERARADRA